MSKFLKALSVAGLTVSAASVFAGGVEQAPMDASGMFVGLGAGYNSTSVSYYAATNANLNDTDTRNNFAPFLQVGYWGHIDQQWMWGVKATYKYLNANTYGLAYDSNTKQAATAQMLIGMNFSQALVYMGFGASYMPTNFDDGVNAGSSDHAAMWGGVVSIGARKDLNQSWFVDTSYSYAFSGKNSLTNNATAATYQARTQVQSLDVSLNYRFAI